MIIIFRKILTVTRQSGGQPIRIRVFSSGTKNKSIISDISWKTACRRHATRKSVYWLVDGGLEGIRGLPCEYQTLKSVRFVAAKRLCRIERITLVHVWCRKCLNPGPAILCCGFRNLRRVISKPFIMQLWSCIASIWRKGTRERRGAPNR